MSQLERFLIIWQVFYPYVQGKNHSVSSIIFLYLRLPIALQGTLFWKKMIFHEIFQVCACPNLKDSLLYDRFSIHMYKARIIRYLQQFSSICDSLMPCAVQFCRKRWIFNVKFQVGACPNMKDSLISEYFSLHTYKTYRVRYHHFFRYLRLPYALQGTLFWKKKFMKYFKLVHAPTWKIPHYMTGFLFICTRQEAICIFNNFPLSATLLCLVRYIFFWKKMNFHEIFQVGACPNLKDSLIYENVSIHLYKT